MRKNSSVRTARSNKVTKNAKKTSVYTPVSKNIYHTGSSYRGRVTVDGERHSKYFSSKRKAITWRNQLLAR